MLSLYLFINILTYFFSMVYYKRMGTDQIMYCIVALILGMLLANMLKNVCGCKDVEGMCTTGCGNKVGDMLDAAGDGLEAVGDDVVGAEDHVLDFL